MLVYLIPAEWAAVFGSSVLTYTQSRFGKLVQSGAADLVG